MATTKQPSALPTNKLTAALIGNVLGALIYTACAGIWPALDGITIEGVGSLSLAFQIITAALLGYVIKDRPNVEGV